MNLSRSLKYSPSAATVIMLLPGHTGRNDQEWTKGAGVVLICMVTAGGMAII